MSKKAKKKAAKKVLSARIFLFMKNFLYTMVAFTLCFLFLSSFSDDYQKRTSLQTQIPEDIATIEQSFMPEVSSCRINTSGQCGYNDIYTASLYDVNDDDAAVIESQNLDDNFVEQSLNIERSVASAKLASLVESGVSFDIVPQHEDVFNSIEIIDHDKVYDLYEEDLPHDVIDESLENKEDEKKLLENGYHIYKNQRSIKNLKISLFKKPPYFGPEPVIAIVIDDMGISSKRTKDILSLHGPLTSSFLTYGKSLKNYLKEAAVAGHEIMIHVPMQPKSNIDIAPDTLTVNMSDEEVKNNFEKMLAEFEGVSGANNHMGSMFTENAEKMSIVMQVLKEKNMFFLDSKTSAKSVGRQKAKEYGIKYAQRHVFLDNENKVEYIRQQLEQTERIARKNGYAVAICHPKSQTYVVLKEWMESLNNKKIKLVHLSEIVDVLNR